MSPSISVIMPAYNAERTIELALRSIRMQTIADQIEILVIDGGSTDATREIAQRYGATILENPHRLPEPAKLIVSSISAMFCSATDTSCFVSSSCLGVPSALIQD